MTTAVARRAIPRRNVSSPRRRVSQTHFSVEGETIPVLSRLPRSYLIIEQDSVVSSHKNFRTASCQLAGSEVFRRQDTEKVTSYGVWLENVVLPFNTPYLVVSNDAVVYRHHDLSKALNGCRNYPGALLGRVYCLTKNRRKILATVAMDPTEVTEQVEFLKFIDTLLD